MNWPPFTAYIAPVERRKTESMISPGSESTVLMGRFPCHALVCRQSLKEAVPERC